MSLIPTEPILTLDFQSVLPFPTPTPFPFGPVVRGLLVGRIVRIRSFEMPCIFHMSPPHRISRSPPLDILFQLHKMCRLLLPSSPQLTSHDASVAMVWCGHTRSSTAVTARRNHVHNFHVYSFLLDNSSVCPPTCPPTKYEFRVSLKIDSMRYSLDMLSHMRDYRTAIYTSTPIPCFHACWIGHLKKYCSQHALTRGICVLRM